MALAFVIPEREGWVLATSIPYHLPIRIAQLDKAKLSTRIND